MTEKEESYIVCALEGTNTRFTDNLSGVCSHCKKGVIYRPNNPAGHLICLECMVEFVVAVSGKPRN